MKIFKSIAIAFVLLVGLAWAAPALAQTASTALVLGTVTDPGGAVVPDATAELTNAATNETKSVATNSAGQYVFPNVAPGTYTLKISKAGFATSTFSSVKLDVAKNYTYDVKLEVSSGKEIIEVSAEAKAELQNVDAVIGNVVGENELMRLPTLGRDSRELLTLQPMSTPFEPTGTGFGNRGGTIAGARSDQNVFNLDGIDITDNVIAGGGRQLPIIPIGVENVAEFRVGVTNNNASFGRSEGGQINIISKSGTNDFHGAVYWYHQNSALNGNTWDNGHTPTTVNGQKLSFTPKPPQHDNRGGISVGGPIRKGKTFFFGNYELRRFPQSTEVERIVPTDTLRNGTLVFGGAQYPLATSMACGTGGNQACDPRGLGISPVVQKLWKMMPEGNDPNVGDVTTINGQPVGNTMGFRTSASEPLKDDFVNFRLDHNFTEKVKFFGRYMYHRDLTPNASGSAGQVSFLSGKAVASSASDIRGDGFTSGLDWQIRENLINSFHAGWIRSRQDFNVIRPRVSAADLNFQETQTPLGQIALAPGLRSTGLIDTVVDVDTQRARHQAIYDSNKQYVDNLTWIKGKHALVAGADVRWLPTIHDRDDKVIGSVNSLVAALDAGGRLSIPAADKPPGLSSADSGRWDRLYSAALGLVNNVGILAVRDGSLNPKPLGTSLIAKTTLRSYNFFAQDSWRIKPSFTLTYGLGYGWQTTPQELHQQQTLIANHDAGDQIINGLQYIQQIRQAAENGTIFNPTLSYIPIKNSGRSDVFDVDYGDWAPRASAAWNPSFREGFLGRILGDRKTVVRGGYGISYDRVNTVQSVIIPMLGVGFAQTINLQAPLCNANGASVSGCNASAGVGSSGNPGLASFRVGVDGTIPTPPLPGSLSSPIVPPIVFAETLSFQNDPSFKDGRAHMVDFTIQRSLPGQMILELGYVGRFARHLAGSINFNSVPYMFKDSASGQIFAQAFDAVATQLRSGVTPILNGAPNPAFQIQPWFENQLPGLGAGCGPNKSTISSTACLALGNNASFVNDNLSDLFITLDVDRQFALGLKPYTNLQVLDLFLRDSNDRSNYNAFVVTLRNNSWRGLVFDMNYTFSKSLDTVGAVQNAALYHTTSFNFNADYGPSFFNRPHVFNGIFNYDLPIGGSHRLSSSTGAFNRVLSGWYTAGIFRASSGFPELVTLTNQSFGGGEIFGIQAGMIPTVPIGSFAGVGVNSGICSTGAGSAGNGPNCATKGTGTGLNYFSDPAAAIKDFRQVLLATDKNDGRSSPLRGLSFWNLDMSLGKSTKISESVKFAISADFFNIFNHVNFLDPSFNVNNPSTFGVINTQLIPADRNQGSRWIQIGLRVEF
jgi:hypothetical protein